MEPRLNSGDKQILEGYVSVFLDRIREVEQIIEQGVEIQNSEVVSIVGGVQHRALLRTSSTRWEKLLSRATLKAPIPRFKKKPFVA